MSDRTNIDNDYAPQLAAANRVSEGLDTDSLGAPSVVPVLGSVVSQAQPDGMVPDLTLLRLEELLNLGLTGNGNGGGGALDAGSLRSLLENAELPADLTSLDISQLLELALSGAQLPTILEVVNLPGPDPVGEIAGATQGDGEGDLLPERAQAGDRSQESAAPQAADAGADPLLSDKDKASDKFGDDDDYDLEASFDGNAAPIGASGLTPPADEPSGNNGRGGNSSNGQGNDSGHGGSQGAAGLGSENAQAGGGSNNGQGGADHANSRAGGEGNGPGSNNGAGFENAQATANSNSGNGAGSNNGHGGGSSTEPAVSQSAGFLLNSNAGGNSANAGGNIAHSNASGTSDHGVGANSGNGGSAIVLASLGFSGSDTQPADVAESAPPANSATTFVSSSDINGAPGNSAFGHSHGAQADDASTIEALPPVAVAPEESGAETPGAIPAGISISGGQKPDVIDGRAGDDQLKGKGAGDTIQGFAGDDTINGGGGNDSLWGGGDDDVLLGRGGSDYLDGGIGADELFGGGGADTLVWDFADLTIDGGSNTDTLRVDGGDADVSAFFLAGGNIQDIEQVDLLGGGDNEITLTYEDVLDMTDKDDTLTVFGDAGDVVDVGSGWTYDGLDSAGYHVFSQGNGSNEATLIVDPEMATVLV